MINNAYSKPDLVIFLYAPAEILYERKGEADIEYLEGRTQSFMKVGKKFKNFVIVDATQDVNKVFEDTKSEIVSYLNNHKN
jgi:thymidylate kinase